VPPHGASTAAGRAISPEKGQGASAQRWRAAKGRERRLRLGEQTPIAWSYSTVQLLAEGGRSDMAAN